MKTRLLLLASLIILIPGLTNAQLLGKLKRAVQDKVEKKIEDKIVEELSEELANRAMKPINKAFDEYLKSSYESETGEKWDQAKFDSVMMAGGEAYANFLGAMNKAANVPAEYNFDYELVVETQEESKQKTTSRMYFSNSSGIMGVEQTEAGDNNFLVMDPDNDVIVLYNDKKKTAQALPSMFSMTKTLGAVYAEDMQDDFVLKSFEKTGKTKKIAGYNSVQYKGETNLDKFTTYISDELPFDWKDIYGGLIESIAPKIYSHGGYDKIEGMMMKSETLDLETNKKSKWEVKKVSDNGMQINKADYTFGGMKE